MAFEELSCASQQPLQAHRCVSEKITQCFYSLGYDFCHAVNTRTSWAWLLESFCIPRLRILLYTGAAAGFSETCRCIPCKASKPVGLKSGGTKALLSINKAKYFLMQA